jgi:hypothetical protein
MKDFNELFSKNYQTEVIEALEELIKQKASESKVIIAKIKEQREKYARVEALKDLQDADKLNGLEVDEEEYKKTDETIRVLLHCENNDYRKKLIKLEKEIEIIEGLIKKHKDAGREQNVSDDL